MCFNKRALPAFKKAGFKPAFFIRTQSKFTSASFFGDEFDNMQYAQNKLRLRGFEPLTFGSVDRRSVQLSYRRNNKDKSDISIRLGL